MGLKWHWGVAVVMRDAPGRADIGWGDSMHLPPPTGILDVIKEVSEDVFEWWSFAVEEEVN